jgi:hypothetical protein
VTSKVFYAGATLVALYLLALPLMRVQHGDYVCTDTKVFVPAVPARYEPGNPYPLSSPGMIPGIPAHTEVKHSCAWVSKPWWLP